MSLSNKMIFNLARQRRRAELIKKARELRDEFRYWYGDLSVEEIIANNKLIEQVAKFERLLKGALGER